MLNSSDRKLLKAFAILVAIKGLPISFCVEPNPIVEVAPGIGRLDKGECDITAGPPN